MASTRYLLLACAILPATAGTVLNFNLCPGGTPTAPCITNPAGWNTVTSEKNSAPAFGDSVTQNLDPNGYGYYGGAANTPNVSVLFDATSSGGWGNWGGAENGLSFAFDTGNGFVSLLAAPGFSVTLNSFDYNVAGAQSYALEVLDGSPSSSTVLDNYDGSTTGAAALSFTPGVTSSELTIHFDNWNTGLQNIDFSQSGAVTPEPGSMALLAAGLGGLSLAARHRRTRW